MSPNHLRTDLELLSNWIQPSSHVLDLGCGDGTLLEHLRQQRQVTGYGLEIDPENVTRCIAAGVNVIQRDLDEGLSDFKDNAFDYVMMTQTLQAIRCPDQLLPEMLRIGREGIVTFPNFGHWLARLQLLRGKMPVSRALPYQWYDTPNIHHCTLRDFEALCQKLNIQILECMVVDPEHKSSWGMRTFPNLLGEIAVYRIQRCLET